MARHSVPIAKITGPRPVKGVIHRDRLFKQIDQLHDSPAVWVTGPGGSGKTTLVSNFLQSRKLPALWYNIDAGDTDIATFFHYTGLAVKEIKPNAEPLPFFTPEYTGSLSIFAKRYFEAFFVRLGNPAILVLDNYQELPAESPLHGVIREILPVVPDRVTVFILSRIEPPSEMALAATRRSIAVLGWKDLRFTLEETHAMVNLVGERPYTRTAVEQLHRKTDGWVAGLLLLLRQSRLDEVDPAFPAAHTPEEVFHYFAAEFFDQAAPETQDFLLATALFPQMTPQMAECLTGVSRAGELLSGLRRSHFFTDRRLGKTAVYEYHPLFREFLLEKGRKAYSSDRLADLYRRAAGLLETEGQMEAAISLYHTSGDMGKMVQLILNQAQTLLFQGRHQTLNQWLGQLPDELVSEEYWLLNWLVTSKVQVEMADNTDIFIKALGTSGKDRDSEAALLSVLGVIESITQEFHSSDAVDKLLPKLHAMCQDIGRFSSVDIKARVVSGFLYLALRQPGHPDFKRWREQAVAILEGRDKIRPDAVIHLVSPIVLHEIFTGELTDAEILLEKYRGLIQQGSAGPMAAIALRNLEAYCCWKKAKFDCCFKAADDGLEAASDAGIHAFSTYLAGHAAAAALSIGDLRLTKKYLKKMKENLGHVRAWGTGYYYNMTTWAALIEGDCGTAEMESRLGHDYMNQIQASHPWSLSHLGRALTHHLRKETGEARAHLEASLEICGQVKNLYVEFSGYLIQAEFAMDAGDESAVLDALRKAMTLGRRQEFVNTYYWRPGVMSRLCEKALNAEIETEYVKSLIRRRNLYPVNPSQVTENWPWPVRIFTLGRFGLEIDGTPFSFSGKVRRTPLMLLKVLIAFGGKDVSETTLQDALWPDADGDAAVNSFSTTLHRLRKMLGHEKAVRVSDGKVSLDDRTCWVDVRLLEKRIKDAESMLETRLDGDLWTEVESTTKQAVRLSSGLFLPKETAPWAIAHRQRLQDGLFRCLQSLVRHHAESADTDKAIHWCNKGLFIDPCNEYFYQQLMRLYAAQGLRSQVLSAYHRCCGNLAVEYGIKPSDETNAVFRKAKGD